MHFKFLLSFILFNLVLPNTLQASKNTKWEFSDWGDSCIIRADNSGVKLVILIRLPLSNNRDGTFINVERPGLFSQMFNSDIHWPSVHEWDDDEDIFASFFSLDPKKIKLPLVQDHGIGSLFTYGNSNNDSIYDFSRYLIKYKNVEIFKNYYSKTGYSTTRLGRWSASSSLGQKALSDFAKCVSK